MLETAYFHYPSAGLVRPSRHNFAGLGACDGGTCTVARWPTARLGVRGQIHHLRAYEDRSVTVSELANPLQSPRFHLVAKGSAATGSGWATAGGRPTR